MKEDIYTVSIGYHDYIFETIEDAVQFFDLAKKIKTDSKLRVSLTTEFQTTVGEGEDE